MTTTAIDESRFQLQRLVMRDGAALMDSQPWSQEQDRWVELVFAVLTEVSPLSEDVLRELAEDMDAFGLLSIPRLALPRSSEEGAASHRRLVGAMTDGGVAGDHAEQVATGLHELAAGLAEHFGGYLQRYLRHYGEMMLKDQEKWFPVQALSREEVASALTYWLQNAVLMPLSNIDAPVAAFCADIGAAPDDLIRAADDLGINLSLLDDLALLRRQAADVRNWEKDLTRSSVAAGEAAE